MNNLLNPLLKKKFLEQFPEQKHSQKFPFSQITFLEVDMISLGTGMFMWDRVERVTSRYGTVYLTNQNWFETSESQVNWHPESADSLIGKKVKISCKVLQARKRCSQHCRS
jgi:hypothetical protein